jgi:cysteine desulfurase
MIYFDHAATTPIDLRVLKKMQPYLEEKFGNPSSIYAIGREARAAIDHARQTIAAILQCTPKEVLFTGSGTESDNWAIFGLVEAQRKNGNHIITTKIEHHAVLYSCQELERRGFKVTYLDVDKNGFINLKELENAITQDTILASIIYANNEIGTIQDIPAISKILQSKKILLHIDACQAPGMIPIDIPALHVDAMTLNSSKIYGPKAVGVLYLKEGTKIAPLLYGGGQEFRMRAGTENVAGIIGMAEALKLITQEQSKHLSKLIKLRDLFIKNLLKLSGTKLNGDPVKRLANNVNVSFEAADGESLLLRLDMEQIAASSGSACTSGSMEPSHVLTALGLPKELIKNSIRLTLGHNNTEEEVETASRTIIRIVKDLRSTSHAS